MVISLEVKRNLGIHFRTEENYDQFFVILFL